MIINVYLWHGALTQSNVISFFSYFFIYLVYIIRKIQFLLYTTQQLKLKGHSNGSFAALGFEFMTFLSIGRMIHLSVFSSPYKNLESILSDSVHKVEESMNKVQNHNTHNHTPIYTLWTI